MRSMMIINCYPVPENAVYKPRLDIYKRQNSDFNRLLTNNVDYSGYDRINDVKPIRGSPNNRYTVNTVDSLNNRQSKSEDYSKEMMEEAESRHRKALKKRPCVPVYPNSGYRRQQQRSQRIRNNGRTLYDLNFYFLGYQPNRYQVSPQQQQTGAISSAVNDVSNADYNHYGGYDCTPNPFYRPPLGFGGLGGYGGSNGAYNDDPSRPSALNVLGQGLFDFINGLFGYGNPNAGGSGGYDTPIASGALNDQQSGSNSERPVYEVNVPDAIQALVRS